MPTVLDEARINRFLLYLCTLAAPLGDLVLPTVEEVVAWVHDASEGRLEDPSIFVEIEKHYEAVGPDLIEQTEKILQEQERLHSVLIGKINELAALTAVLKGRTVATQQAEAEIGQMPEQLLTAANAAEYANLRGIAALKKLQASSMLCAALLSYRMARLTETQAAGVRAEIERGRTRLRKLNAQLVDLNNQKVYYEKDLRTTIFSCEFLDHKDFFHAWGVSEGVAAAQGPSRPSAASSVSSASASASASASESGRGRGRGGRGGKRPLAPTTEEAEAAERKAEAKAAADDADALVDEIQVVIAANHKEAVERYAEARRSEA
eukprot:CAMPEP_0119366148 /NCGR_PEP_ID=MMETSP1334-20130426/13019_1 /TAXON_ID=127549 /ORGANISM="Calcidiscus leptoporus, Strain RCC1130" /LENGTH=321 /DNA_ID=CAMNT_0007382283 /DNA_START=83 /DNA_END=1049 /DNA_ORIENTATION=+